MYKKLQIGGKVVIFAIQSSYPKSTGSPRGPSAIMTSPTPHEQTHSFDDAFRASRTYFGGDELAARVWVSKYALKDSFGNIYELTPADMHRRIASEIVRIEQKYPRPMSFD